jgi:acyl dehydratase
MIPDYQIRAHNDATTSENRIHSDEIAKRFGFTGALVSGVSVFGYLSYPMVKAYGEEWLTRGVARVKFLKPAYQDDQLIIRTENLGQQDIDKQRNHITSACNEQGVLLATMESWLPEEFAEVDALAAAEPATEQQVREEISWEKIHLQQPTCIRRWTMSLADSLHYVNIMRDDLPLYREGDAPLLHPYYLLQECNKALMRQFIMPAWIHTGSAVTFRHALRVGKALEMFAVPVQKWEHKGHQFIKLYMVIRADDKVALEVEHTAIFRIAA